MPDLSSVRLDELAPGIHAYVQPDGGWCLNNAGLVVGTATTVAIDTAATEARARRLRDGIEQVAPGGPRILVNTHFHGDHTFGNAQFPAATLVAHERARVEMAEAGLGLRSLWPDVAWGETPLTLPVLTFSDALTLHVGDGVRVELIHPGPAHTTGDAVAWIPAHRVLFAGDLLWSGVTPFCLMGSVSGSLAVIERLRALDPAVIVPGHGPVGSAEILDANRDYLRWVQQVAAQGVRDRISPLEAAKGVDLGVFSTLLDPERLVGNLHRAYAEEQGQPAGARIDVAAAFGDMIAYHGGLPPCHA